MRWTFPIFQTFLHFGSVIVRLARMPEFRALLLLVLSYLAIGTVLYRIVEKWSWVDALYFCVITLTTIGYGDIAPKTELGRLLTIFYVLLGLGLIGSFIGFIGQQILRAEQPTSNSNS